MLNNVNDGQMKNSSKTQQILKSIQYFVTSSESLQTLCEKSNKVKNRNGKYVKVTTTRPKSRKQQKAI